MAARHLPPTAEQVANAQGWDAESIVIHLAGFIAKEGLNDKLVGYFDAVAIEENEG